MFIHLVLSPEEKEKMLENIVDAFKHEGEFSDDFIEKLEYLDKNQILDLYLDEKGDYYPVSSPEFGERFGLDPNPSQLLCIEPYWVWLTGLNAIVCFSPFISHFLNQPFDLLCLHFYGFLISN